MSEQLPNSFDYTSPTFSVRRILEEEIPQAILLEKVGGLTSFSEKSYQKQLVDPTSICIALIEHAKSPIGISCSRIVGVLSSKIILDELHIDTLVIHPDLTRRGFGRILLQTLLNMASHRGCRSALLEVRQRNTGARYLYESVGFSEAGIRSKYYQNPLDDAIILSLAWSQ